MGGGGFGCLFVCLFNAVAAHYGAGVKDEKHRVCTNPFMRLDLVHQNVFFRFPIFYESSKIRRFTFLTACSQCRVVLIPVVFVFVSVRFFFFFTDLSSEIQSSQSINI